MPWQGGRARWFFMSLPTETILLFFYNPMNLYIQRKLTGKDEPKVSMYEKSLSFNPHLILKKPKKTIGFKRPWSVSKWGYSEQGRTLEALLPILTYIMLDSVNPQAGLQINFALPFLPKTASLHCLVYLVCSGNHWIHRGWKKTQPTFFLV